MHFLKKLIETPQLEEPGKNFFEVHRHFYRYSRGNFIGPAILITQTKEKITLKGTHEYEDLIQEIGCITSNKEQFNITGVLEAGNDITNIFTNLGLEWKLKKTSGQKKIYKADIADSLNRDVLLEIIKALRKSSYFLISFNNGPSNKVTTKKRIPQPSKKKVEDDDLSKRVSFCTGIIENTDKNLKLLEDLILMDFKSEIRDDWKKITLTNNYMIDEIEVPKNVESSLLKRIMAIRKGKMIRALDVDGELIEKQYNIIV